MKFCQEHRDQYNRLVEKLCTAIAGEDRKIVLLTLAIFVREMCDTLHVELSEFFALVKAAEEDEPARPVAKA